MASQTCGICFKAGCERQISGSGIPCISYEDRATIRADIGDAKFDAIDALAPLDRRTVAAYCEARWRNDCQNERPNLLLDTVAKHADAAEMETLGTVIAVGGTILTTDRGIYQVGEPVFTGGPLTAFDQAPVTVDPELQALWNKYVAAIDARRVNAADINTRLRLHGEFGELLSLVAAPDFVERETPFLVAQWGTVPTPFGMVVALTLRSEGRDGCWFWRLESIAEAWHGDMQSIHALFSDAEFRERHGISRDQPAAEAGSDFLAAVRDIARGS